MLRARHGAFLTAILFLFPVLSQAAIEKQRLKCSDVESLALAGDPGRCTQVFFLSAD